MTRRTKVLVLSDTHLRPGRGSGLPHAVHAALDEVDLVLHAGDIVTAELLDELSGWAPVRAVLGNNDLDPALAHLPEASVDLVEGVRVAMVHDSGARTGRAARLRRRFPDADVVVFGHSHVPFCERGVEGQLLFNPGSPTQRRAQPHPTFGLLEVEGRDVVRHDIVVVGG